jgi:C4-dicarboxylate-specific signal transduction histidine kinase
MSPSRNDIKFFGTLSAALTHDMKNFLAIINENAGLLADLSAKARDRAIPVDPLKAAAISEKIEKQVVRADDMIKRFNRFAHSMDHDAETVDMEEAVNLVARLAERIFRQDRIRLTVTPAAAPCRIHASRFALLHLIFRALEILCRNQIDGSSDNEKPATIRFGSDPKIPEICFIRDYGPALGEKNLFDSPEDQALLTRVNMAIKPMDSGTGFCLFTIPPEHR